MQPIPAQQQHLEAMVSILRANPLFERYGLDESKAWALLEGAMQDPQSHLWVLCQGEQCLGFAWVDQKGAFGRSNYLRLIAMHPHSQGQGLGQKLMQHFEQSLDHPYGVFLLTTADNEGAQRFYEKMHYQRIGVLPSYVLPGIDEVIYFKPKDQLSSETK